MIKTPLSTVIGGAFWTPEATIISGQQSFSQLVKKLFSNNEQGFFYDPNDLSTMFQDSAGTIPVTGVGQPVGLMLDKSKGLRLGVNQMMYPNSQALPATINMSDGVYTWTLNTQNPISGVQDSRLVVSVVSSSAARPSIAFTLNTPLVAGKVYKFQFKYKVNSGSPRIRSIHKGDDLASIPIDKGTLIGRGTFETYVQWSVGGQVVPYIYFGNESVFDIQMNEFSIQEVLGNHAYQTTSSMRPLLIASPQRLDYDIADDKLITTLPAQLTSCTVIRSVPNVGTQILTGQTIPATYNDNKDHCGLIVINRALTPSETSAITAELNKRAGV